MQAGSNPCYTRRGIPAPGSYTVHQIFNLLMTRMGMPMMSARGLEPRFLWKIGSIPGRLFHSNAGLAAVVAMAVAGCSGEDSANPGGTGGVTATGGTAPMGTGAASGTGASAGSGAAPATGGTTGAGATGSGGTGAVSVETPVVVSCDTVVTDGVVAMNDANNYSYSVDFQIERLKLKTATDFTVYWNEITRDFFGKPVNSAEDINLVLISLWSESPDVFVEDLNQDKISRPNLVGGLLSYPDGTFTDANLLEFGGMGTEEVGPERIWPYFDPAYPDYATPDVHTFTIFTFAGIDPDHGMPGMAVLFDTDPNGETEVHLKDTSTTLNWDTNLGGVTPVAVPVGKADLTLDWAGVTKTALGKDFDITQITEAAVGHYPNHTLADLDANLWDLRTLAQGWWSAEVWSGTSMATTELKDASGNAFPGVDGTGVWLAALYCTTTSCRHPAPWAIAVLQGCP